MDPKTMCCCFCFGLAIIVLILAIVFCKCKSVDEFTDVVNANTDTMKHKLMGGKYYHAMQPDEKVVEMMEELKRQGKCGLFALVADWCGYCKKLKESGVLNEVSKHYPVYIMSEKHKETKDFMNAVKSQGFPTLVVFYNGKIKKYEGGRDKDSIMSFLKSMH